MTSIYEILTTKLCAHDKMAFN